MRYFDKTFFKFTLGFLIIIVISLLIIYAASAYAAGIDKIVFTTDSQSIKPNELSGPIKIQFQNSSGTASSFGETQQLLLEASSVGGQFSNDSGEDFSATINSNWTSRTFYYSNSSEGTFTITASIVGTNLSANQQITVSSNALQNNDSNSSGEVLGASNSLSSSASSGGSTTDKVSSLNAQLEIVAGSDRATSPGSPIWFQATVKKNTTEASLELNWSFGDGNVGVGPLVSHSYKYPGDYVVVLSSRAGDIFSVSRLKVKVADSDISVSDKGEYLEISNNGNTEINLFNWRLENEGKGFIFQPNTIILPHSSIDLDKSILTMKGLDNSSGTSLKNSLGKEVFFIAPVKESDFGAISYQANEIQKQVYSLVNKAIAAKLVVEKSPAIQESSLYQGEVKGNSVNVELAGDISSSSAENIIYEAPKKPSILTRAWNFLVGMLH